MKALKLFFFGVIVFSIIRTCGNCMCSPEVEKKPVDPVADSLARREERISKGFSSWDGSHIALESFVKEAMNDPNSYEHDETRYRQIGQDTIYVIMTFRGRNGFGGMVKQTVTGYADLDGNLISVPVFL